MYPARKGSKHFGCLAFGTRLSEYFPVKRNNGVGADHGGFTVILSNRLSLLQGKRHNNLLRQSFFGNNLVYIGTDHVKPEARQGHQLTSSRRSGGKNNIRHHHSPLSLRCLTLSTAAWVLPSFISLLITISTALPRGIFSTLRNSSSSRC